VIATMQRVGAAIGIAVIGSVLFTLVANVAPSIHSQADLGTAFTNASAGAIGVSVIFAVVAFALVFALPRRLSQQRAAH
jgi:hypothetical protein